jgi:DNA-binding MarR family transcriptional regulator
MGAPDPAGGTPASAGASALECDLGFALGVVFRSYIKAANAVIGKIPGGPRGYQVLAAAVSDEAGSQASLAQRLGVDRTVMTYLLDDLEKKGLVKRRPDPSDRRNRHIVATRRGSEQLCDSQRQLRLAEDRILSGLSAEDAGAFRDLLRQLAARLNRLDPVEHACQVVTDLEPPGGTV